MFRSTETTEETTASGVIGTLRLQSTGSTAWEWSSSQGIKVSCAHSGQYGNTEIVIHGGWDGYVYQQESGVTFDGSPIVALYRTPYLVYGDPNIRKILYKIRVTVS